QHDDENANHDAQTRVHSKPSDDSRHMERRPKTTIEVLAENGGLDEQDHDAPHAPQRFEHPGTRRDAAPQRFCRSFADGGPHDRRGDREQGARNRPDQDRQGDFEAVFDISPLVIPWRKLATAAANMPRDLDDVADQQQIRDDQPDEEKAGRRGEQLAPPARRSDHEEERLTEIQAHRRPGGLPLRQATGTSVGLDLGEAFFFVIRSTGWWRKLLAAAACLLFIWLIVPYLLLVGYIIEIARHVRSGGRQLPPWDHQGRNIKDGFKVALAILIWTIPSALLSIPAAIVGAAVSEGSTKALGGSIAAGAGVVEALGRVWGGMVLLIE